MPDEANAHWESILMQLTEGQTWLKKHLNVTPISSWSIDPFGLSPTLPYLLKHSGFENLLIQRTHYSIKKRLAKEKQLEFRWRQIWGILKQKFNILVWTNEHREDGGGVGERKSDG